MRHTGSYEVMDFVVLVDWFDSQSGVEDTDEFIIAANSRNEAIKMALSSMTKHCIQNNYPACEPVNVFTFPK